MILYFADRRMKILGQASTSLPEGFVITEDLKTEDVDTGVATFSCTIGFDSKNRTKLAEITKVGNYLLRSEGIENEFYTILETEENTETQEVQIYAEDAGLDLLNEIAIAYAADKAYPISHYVEKFSYDSGFTIGINEIENLSRKLTWDGEETRTARLASVARQFDNAEISYSFEVSGMSVVAKYIDIYKERGKDVGASLRLNKEVNKIVTKKSIANLATALRVTGGIPEGEENPITLDGYSYDDGDFFLEGTYLKSREAVAIWSRYLSEKGDYTGHICKSFTYDTTSQSELCNRAISELKKLREVEVNYEVEINELPENIKIGDRINIIDDAGELYLSARILMLETSVTEQRQTATLGEYLIKSSGISERVTELAEQFEESAKKRPFYTWIAYADDAIGTGISLNPDGKKYMGTATNRTVKAADISDPFAYTWAKVQGDSGADSVVLRIDSSRGTVFKNSEVSTVLSAVIYKGATRITDINALKAEFGSGAYIQWNWQKMGEDTFGTILSTDERLGNDGFTLALSPEDVDTKVVFRCDLITD